MKPFKKFILINTLILALLAVGYAQDTYRTLINQIKPESGRLSLRGTYRCLDSLNQLVNFRFTMLSLNPECHQIQLISVKGDSILLTKNRRILTLGFPRSLSGYDQLSLFSIYLHLSWFIHPQCWESIIKSCSFELDEAENDSVMVLTLSSGLTNPAKIQIYYTASNSQIFRIESYSDDSLQDMLEFTRIEADSGAEFLPMNQAGQYSFYCLGEGESEKIDQILVPGIRPLKSIKGGYALIHQYLGQQDGLQILAEYFSGTQTLLAVYNPVISQELKDIGPIDYQFNLSPHRIRQFIGQGITFYWVGNLKSSDLQAIKDQYRYKIRVSGTGQLHLTPGRIVLAVFLSALLIFVFLRMGRKRMHS